MTPGTTENCMSTDVMSVDVRSWHREGLLWAGQRFSRPVTRMSGPTVGINVLIEADAVLLIFRSQRWGGESGRTIRQRVPLAWTPCTLGGRRPWFRCDAYSRGRYCGRRVAMLYSHGEVFACRHCHRRGRQRSVHSRCQTPRGHRRSQFELPPVQHQWPSLTTFLPAPSPSLGRLRGWECTER
jgi:hypothetical protein